MIQNRYSIGDRVVVVKNSERTLHNSFIGMEGSVIGYRSKDALIRFDNGEEHFIYEKDLDGLDRQ